MLKCAGKSRPEEIELLALDESDIRVAQFITEELPKSIFASKLHEAIKHARQKLADQVPIAKNIEQVRNSLEP